VSTSSTGQYVAYLTSTSSSASSTTSVVYISSTYGSSWSVSLTYRSRHRVYQYRVPGRT
jgi:hypothetical protein